MIGAIRADIDICGLVKKRHNYLRYRNCRLHLVTAARRKGNSGS